MVREREKPRRSIREDFARFYEQPSRETLRELLKNHVGELSVLDFKESWPEASRLARHVLAFANSGGGAMVIGVRELADKSLEPAGLSALTDKADVRKALARFLPETVSTEVLDFSYDASEYPTLVGKRFQVLSVDSDPRRLPYLAKTDGDRVRANAVYVRRGAASEEATQNELQDLFNQRVETGYSSRPELDLAAHLKQLRLLYSSISREERRIVDHGIQARGMLKIALELSGQREEIVRNSAYPKESFDEFIARMIEKKKRVIEATLGASET